MSTTRLLEKDEMARVLERLASQILERHAACDDVMLVGIERRGADLARRLAALLQSRLGHAVPLGTLDINLYRDEPILHQPFNLLRSLIDIDELFTSWRYRHAQMVLRMLGRKIGTGGSSGHDYLHATAVKHHIFSDLHNISTLLIPRSELPDLPADLRQQLGFYYTEEIRSEK